MKNFIIESYFIISLITSMIAFVIALLCFKRDEVKGNILGLSCLFSAMVNLSYTFSLFASSHFYMSLFSTFYFVSIDITLLSLLEFMILFTRNSRPKYMPFVYGYAVFDAVVLLINPFWEIAVHFVHRDISIGAYSYIKMPLFWGHLIFSYILVSMVLCLLLNRLHKIPQEYKPFYRLTVFIILGIVALNASYLYFPTPSYFDMMDYSVWGYALGCIMIYWICFIFGRKGTTEGVRDAVIDNISQGIIMFDFDGYLVMKNKTAEKIFQRFKLNEQTTLSDFIFRTNLAKLNEKVRNESEDCSIQCYIDDVSYRCDYHPLTNERKQLLGRMFSFTDITAEADLLTGFHNWEYFRRNLLREKEKFAHSGVVYMADINGLTNINQNHGRREGDAVIKRLAELMKKVLPSESYFIRGNDAIVMAISWFVTTEEIRKLALKVEELSEQSITWSITEIQDGEIIAAVNEATATLNRKKLIDNDSTRSNMISSLIRALKETDDDTEEHVLRTQKMGDSLGRRLGLSDSQLSKLLLLCVLHDIGKIGVPLEVLNKPSSLNAEEWELMMSHVEKGYQIAKSSSEIEDIAKEIRHHHERWDGTGYPDGLKGNQIPLLSRIISLVDAHDAMTHDRVYHKAISEEEAEAELLRCAGTQFDPYLTKEFIEVLKTHAEQTKKQIPEERSIVNTIVEERNVHEVHYSSYTLDNDMNIISIDQAFVDMTGWTMADIEKNHMKQIDLIPEEDRMEYLGILNVKISNDKRAFFEHRLLCKSGDLIYVNCFGRFKYNAVRKENTTEIIISNILDSQTLKLLSKRQKDLHITDYYIDNLTGLLTYEAMKIDTSLKLLKNDSRVIYLKMRLDTYSVYLERYGEKQANDLLVLFSKNLSGTLRNADLACRINREFFAATLFFPVKMDVEAIKKRLFSIYERIDLVTKNQLPEFSYSMGMVLGLVNTTSLEILDEKADEALKDNSGPIFIQL